MGNRWDGEVEEERRSEAESEVDLAGMISELTRECSLLVFSFALQIILLYEALRKRLFSMCVVRFSMRLNYRHALNCFHGHFYVFAPCQLKSALL